MVVTRSAGLEERILSGGYEGDVRAFGDLVDEVSEVTTVVQTKNGRSAKPSVRTLYLFSRALVVCKLRENKTLGVKEVLALSSLRGRCGDGPHTLVLVDTSDDCQYACTCPRMVAADWLGTIQQLQAGLRVAGEPALSPNVPNAAKRIAR